MKINYTVEQLYAELNAGNAVYDELKDEFMTQSECEKRGLADSDECYDVENMIGRMEA